MEKGLTVHATVRGPDAKDKLHSLNALADDPPGSLKFFKADLLSKEGFADAIEGCGVVFHTASPFTSNYQDPKRDLIDPALIGTRNVLETAKSFDTVKRVVVTSSCAAIYTDATECDLVEGGVLTEAHWNETASPDYQPYSYSKTLAEREAWKIAEDSPFDLLTALLTLQVRFGQDYKLPKRAAPKWLVWLLAPFIKLDRKIIANNVNIEWRADNSKSREVLSIVHFLKH